jgi:hypothetical protein
VFLDQIEFPLPRPALDRLLAPDGDIDVIVAFKPDKAFDVVARSEAGKVSSRC